MALWCCCISAGPGNTYRKTIEMLHPWRKRHSLVSTLQFVSQFNEDCISFRQVHFQRSFLTCSVLHVQVSICPSLWTGVFKKLPLLQKKLWLSGFSHKHSKKHEEQKLRVMFILISWCLSIQHDFLSCLVAEAGTKKPKTTILSWHFFTKKPIKILCIYVSLCLDEMHLNIGIIDIGMIPCPDVFHTQDPHSLKIPCRLLVHERMRERVS